MDRVSNASMFRALEPWEIELVSGGDYDGEDIVVYGGDGGGDGGDPYGGYDPAGGYDPSNNGGETGGSSGSSGSTSTNYTHGSVRTTAGGHSYTLDIDLNDAQAKIVDQIVDYGMDHQKSAQEIQIAVSDAFYESSFDPTASKGDHDGIYQYDQRTWNDLGEAGSRFNTGDQIAAIYNDISNYEARYADVMSTDAYQIRESGIDFNMYFEVKHELGNNATDWHRTNDQTGNEYIVDYSSKEAQINYHGR